jgi:peptidoglycan/LPS O-acetylase OafA/YrhL
MNAMRRYNNLKNVDVKHFYILRFARIMPPLFFFVITIAAGQLAEVPRFHFGDDEVPDYLVVISLFLFFHNVLIIEYGWFSYCVNICWSLSIEEAFYVLFPVVLVILRRASIIAAACIMLIIVGPIYRLSAETPAIQYQGFLSCFVAVAVGVLIAIVINDVELKKAMSVLLCLAGSMMLLWISIAKAEISIVFGDSGIALGTAMILMSTRSRNIHKPRAWSRLVGWFGRHSYELYLFHIIVLALMRSVAGPGPITIEWRPAWLVVFVSLSSIVSAILARWIFNPVNRKLRLWLHAKPTGHIWRSPA